MANNVLPFGDAQLLAARINNEIEKKGFFPGDSYLIIYADRASGSAKYRIDKDTDEESIYLRSDSLEGMFSEFVRRFAEVPSAEDARKIELSKLLARASALGADIGLGAAFVEQLKAESEKLASNALPKPTASDEVDF